MRGLFFFPFDSFAAVFFSGDFKAGFIDRTTPMRTGR